jgi:hypothetical protein
MKYRACRIRRPPVLKPLPETRQRPALDGPGEGEPAQQIPEVVRDDVRQEPHLSAREKLRRRKHQDSLRTAIGETTKLRSTRKAARWSRRQVWNGANGSGWMADGWATKGML